MLVRSLALALLLAAALALPAAADEGHQAGNLYARALLAENADGNIEEAIEAYQRIVQHHKQSRVFAARALYRLGMLYRRLGKHDAAEEAFKGVLHQFKDQHEIARLAEQALHHKAEGHSREEERARDMARAKAMAAREREMAERGHKKDAHAHEKKRLDEMAAKLERAGVGPDLREMRVKLEAESLALRHEIERRLHAVRDALGERPEAERNEALGGAKKLAGAVIEALEKRVEALDRLIGLQAKAHELEKAGRREELERMQHEMKKAGGELEKAVHVAHREQEAAMARLHDWLARLAPGAHRPHGKHEPAERERAQDAERARHAARERAVHAEREEAERREREHQKRGHHDAEQAERHRHAAAAAEKELAALAEKMKSAGVPGELAEMRVRLAHEGLRLRMGAAARLEKMAAALREHPDRGRPELLAKAQAHLQELAETLKKRIQVADEAIHLWVEQKAATEKGAEERVRELEKARAELGARMEKLARVQEDQAARFEHLVRELGPSPTRPEHKRHEATRPADGHQEHEGLVRALREREELLARMHKQMEAQAQRLKALEAELEALRKARK